jgi:tetratricopeptide (TPR) repeat protein
VRILNCGKLRARSRRFIYAAVMLLCALPASAQQGEDEGCGRRGGTPDERIAACTGIVESRLSKPLEVANALRVRGIALRQKGELDRAIADFDQAIKIDPQDARFYNSRGIALRMKNDLDRAIADHDKAIQLDPKRAVFYSERGIDFRQKGDLDRAIAEHTRAIGIDPKLAFAYNNRGFAWRQKGDLDRALADYDQAIKLNPKHFNALGNRASVWRAKGDINRAIADLDQAIKTNPKAVAGYVDRGRAYESRNDRERAIADFKAALALPAIEERGKRAQDTARTRLALLTAADSAPTPSAPASTPGAQGPGSRVALVIGNGAYVNAGALPNPANDARAVARVLREIGFDVAEGVNLDHRSQERLVRDFLRKAANARVALLFYAGHGMQVEGKNFLVPVDAKLTARTDLPFETLELDKILAGLDDESRTNILILDACRDNPLAKNFARTASRSASSPAGLAPVSSVGSGTLIAYATAPDQVALDGDAGNSPFTAALVKHLRTPGLEVRQMLTRVRAEVIAATQRKQVPWDNSSLLGDVYLAGGGRQ